MELQGLPLANIAYNHIDITKSFISFLNVLFELLENIF